jgi:peroxiredoxin
MSSRAASWLSGMLAAVIGLALPAAHSATGASTAYALLGQHAPDFALHAQSGDNVRLSEHLGDVIVISFWSTHCAACWSQLESLDRSLQTYHTAGLQMYGVDVDAEGPGHTPFALSVLLDPERSVSRSYQIDDLPMTVLIDRSGTIRYVHRGYIGRKQGLYLQQLRSLLDE